MKRFISMLMVVAMLAMGGISAQCTETATTLENGKVVYASPGYKNPENYIVNISFDGDMILDLETDGSIYIQVMDESGRSIAPKEYVEKTEYGTRAGKDSLGYYLSYLNSNTTKAAKADFVYSVKSGRYTIVLKSMHGQLCSVKLTPKLPEGITVTLDGKKIKFDQPPVIINGRTLVPVRAVFESIGASVGWKAETRTVTIKKGSKSVNLTIGSNIIKTGDKEIKIDVPAQIINGRTLIPVRAVAEEFQCEVDWDARKKTVIIESR